MTTPVFRMLALVPWILARPGVALAEVAEAFGTDVATVRGELETLVYCGPRLEASYEFEVNFGADDTVTIGMADELRRPLRLRPDEALRLVLVLTAAQRITQGDVPGLGSALAKVRAAVGVDEHAAVAVVDDAGHLDDLRRAVDAGLVVELDYLGRKDSRAQHRRVEPWRVDITREGQYLQGHDLDRDAHRVFRLDRVTTLVVTDRAATTPAPADLPVPRWVPDDDAVRAVLALRPGAHFVADYVRADVDEVVDGVRHVELRTDALDWLADLVLGGGAAVDVVEPPELRRLVAQRASAGLAAYDGHVATTSAPA